MKLVSGNTEEIERKVPGARAIESDDCLRGWRRTTWATNLDGLRLEVSRDPWFHDEYCFYPHRKIRYAVSDVGRAIARGLFIEWGWEPDRDRLPDLESFFEEGPDRESINHVEMGNAVLSAWRDAEEENGACPLHFGNIVEFKRLRIEGAAASQSATIWKLIDKVIEREFRRPRGGRNRASIIVLKAYPLEYEQDSRDRPADESGFDRRQAAMIRLYGRRLGARSFGGEEVQPGWLWIEINCPFDPTPRSSKLPKLRGKV